MPNTPNPTDELRPMYEKVEALFDLRVSSSGADMGIGFKTSKERSGIDRIWIDGDEWIAIRKSIEHLFNSHIQTVLEDLTKKSVHYTSDKLVDGLDPWAVPVVTVTKYLNGEQE